MTKYYGKEIKLRQQSIDGEEGKVLYTIRDLSELKELDLDTFISDMNVANVTAMKKVQAKLEAGEDSDSVTLYVKDIIKELDKNDIVKLAIWGKENVVELEDKTYFDTAISMYTVLKLFADYRAEFKKKL